MVRKREEDGPPQGPVADSVLIQDLLDGCLRHRPDRLPRG